LLVSDSTSVVGMQPVMMDKLKIDAVFASSQKGLGGIVGLAPVLLSNRAVYVLIVHYIKAQINMQVAVFYVIKTFLRERIKRRQRPPRGYQTDIYQTAQQWNGTAFFHSYSVPAIYSLRDALAFIAEEGITNTFDRHVRATKQLHQGMESLGLRHFVTDPNDRMIGITTFHIPDGKDHNKIAQYMLDRYFLTKFI